jgi:glycosyltransferase involved in cell wall biosynthesis
MKILILAHKMPYPPRDGGSIVTLNYAKAFAKLGHDVTVLAMQTYKRKFNIEDIPCELKKMMSFYTEYVDTKIKPLHLFINLFSDKSYHIWRYGSSKNFAKKLVEILKNGNFDIVQLEGLYLDPYLELIRENSNSKVIMRAHNVEFEILERYAEFEKSPLRKTWLKIQAQRLKKYELSRLKLYDAIVPISNKDAEKLSQSDVPLFVSDGVIDMSEQLVETSTVEFPSLFYIGALDWFPNQQGLEWFFENVWNEIILKKPDLKFYLAGRNPDAWDFIKRRKLKNVITLGEIDDAYEFMKSKSIMIVPLFAGSGIRVKIIEAMALGKVVISTRIGAEGIDCIDGENILIADTKEEFIEKILKCVGDFELCSKIGGEARKLAIEKYDVNEKASKLIEFYERIRK